MRGLVRRRLVDAFMELPGPKRAGVVVAPAGHGKTTLLSHLAATFDGPVRWLTCERRDAVPSVLLARLAALLAGLAQPPGEAQAAGPDEVLAGLEEGRHRPALLIVDDAYLLGDGPSAAVIGRLMSPSLPRLSVLCASREALPVDLSRLRVSDQLVEIGADDLRFRTWEVESLLRDVYGEPLGPEDVARLARRTQGWAACLQLFHLATRGKAAAERRAVLETLHHRSRLVREFLTRNVLDQLPDPLRDFLVRTSVLQRPTGPLCDALLGQEGSRAVLAELERRQLFTVRLDGQVVYRYHQVLRSYCLAELIEREGEVRVAALFRRAGQLMETAGDAEGAFEAYVAAGDRADALRLLDQQGDALVPSARGLLEVLPGPWIESDPWLGLARARQLVAGGQLGAAAAVYAATGDHAPPTAAGLLARERRAVGLWLSAEAPRAADLADWPGLLRAAVQRDPLEAAGQLSALPGSAARLAEAVALALAGHLPAARLALADAAGAPDASVWVTAVSHVLASVDRLLHAPPPAAPMVLVVDGLDAPAMVRLAQAAATLSDPDAERADALIQQLARAARREGDVWGTALIGALGAVGLWRRGHASAATRLRAAGQAFADLGAAVPRAWLLGLAALTPVSDHDDLAAALAAARGAGVPVLVGLLEDRLPPLQPGATAPAAAAVRPDLELTGVSVRCFGSFELVLDGRAADLTGLRPRTRALLHLLAAYGGRGVHRDQLCEALWPRADAVSALRNVQVAVSSLRQTVPAALGRDVPVVRREGERYALDLGADAVFDVAVFEDAVARARGDLAGGHNSAALEALDEALARQHEPLLAAEGSVGWVVERRDRLVEDAVWAAIELSRRLLEQGMAAAAAEVCQRGLRLDPYRDELWRRLVSAADRAGDQAEAARYRRRYHQMLCELGVSEMSVAQPV
ncbi:MAG TPA: BTAD domain-containing putative transcriptional regulator [Acidimicrobiales bacterium]|nr:BTAD domain-containing putative transcriptional regulator [Acidimicrobiales bacterium]